MPEYIAIKGARVNNLKNISLKIPKHSLTVITGLSGSGKSSLAFDTIYAEGQRRYAESLNAYARQFLDVQDKPDVDEITGLSPTIAIDQRNATQNPRSTLGTVTEIYDALRLLFARLGRQFCPETNAPVTAYTSGEITEAIRGICRQHPLLILSPVSLDHATNQRDIVHRLEQSGYETIRLNGALLKIANLKQHDLTEKKYPLEILIGRAHDVKKQNIASLVDKALDLSNGTILAVNEDSDEEINYSTYPFCATSNRRFEPIEPRTFSFNSPYGACPRCTGLGYTLDVDPELVIPNPRLTLAEGAIQPWTRIVGNQAQYLKLLAAVAEAHNFAMDVPVSELPQAALDIIFYGTDGETYTVEGKKTHFDGVIPNLTQRHAETDSDYVRKEIEQYMREKICPACDGKRLKPESLAVRIGEWSIADIAAMSVEEAAVFLSTIFLDQEKTDLKLKKSERAIAAPIVKEVAKRLDDLLQVGLGYLTLDRPFHTLSGGEAQRIRLSTQLSTGLTDVIYILDEPSIGLHPKDTAKLIDTLKTLRDLGNTVIVVEHDAAMMVAADHVIDIGPGAGEYGGQIVAEGSPETIKKHAASLTGQYLSGRELIAIPKKTRTGNNHAITIVGAKAYNLRNIDVSIPLGKLVCVTGVSGSGKSTLIIDVLSRALHRHFYRAKAEVAWHDDIKGMAALDKVISIDQSPIGRTPRSNPATYTGIFTTIRDLFTAVPEARMRSYDAGMFSFNVKGGGRCEACGGEGYTRIPMQFLTDVFVECAECAGRRYNKEALEIHYRNKHIADVLAMTVEEAYRFFSDAPALAERLQILRDVGLGYIHLGQPATTLSGGEAQRIKLATELSRRATGKTLYILDEPTTGLHFEDIKHLL
ncbi:MAG: excinuclease ABC subunit UvrA, partial [Candidatus Magasanikbacteria bacterium]|nr:excinuclease ABC subunit UvrA [Candidatus Magasanikbacteria bacterium]